MDPQLLQAKQALSDRLLNLGLRANVAAMQRTFRVEAAIAAAGRNVHAVGIGRKVVDGKPTKDMAIRLYVVQKLAPSLLPPRDRLPESIDGIPTDVIESSPAFLAAKKSRTRSRGHLRRGPAPTAIAAAAAIESCTVNRQKRQRPLVAGISVAPAFGLGGDSGSLVVSKAAANAVGLYFAGPPSGSYGIANPIADVLSQMQIELVTDVA
jgi:hypothetical protein